MRDEACPMSGTTGAEKGDPIYMGKVSKQCHHAREGFALHPGGRSCEVRWEATQIPVDMPRGPGHIFHYP